MNARVFWIVLVVGLAWFVAHNIAHGRGWFTG